MYGSDCAVAVELAALQCSVVGFILCELSVLITVELYIVRLVRIILLYMYYLLIFSVVTTITGRFKLNFK